MKNINYLLRFVVNEPDYAISLLKHKILNLFNFKSSKLKKISFLLAYKCNLSCLMCALGKNRNNEIQSALLHQELHLQDIKDIIDFAQMKNSSIWLTGGEPLLNERWYEIASYVKEKKLRCYLQTNGVLLEKYKNEIVSNIDFLNVSADGTHLTHDIIRGQKDTFNKMLSGLKEINEAKKILGRKKPYINICYTVTKESYKFIDEMIKILQDAEIEIANLNFQHLEFINSAIFDRYIKRFKEEGKNESILNIFSDDTSDIDAQYLAEKIKELKNSKLKFSIVFSPDISCEDIKKYYQSPQYLPKKIFRKCTRPYEEIFVHPSGEVWSCPTKVFGNIREEKFEVIWNRIISNASKNEEVCQECLGELYMYHMIVLYLLGKK